jgi:DNA-binding NarL/FixJ family response regulator
MLVPGDAPGGDDLFMRGDAATRGWAALRVGDGATARAAFSDATANDGPSAEVWEGLASASFILLEYPRALEEMESAYAAHRAVGDDASAARVARMLGGMHGTTSGDWAVASGWIGRAKTLLRDLPDSSERGWVALTEGMFEPQRDLKNDAFEKAAAVGRRVGDPELTFAALAYLGASLVHDDQVAEGMRLLDESLAAVVGGDVENFIVVEEIFCQMFSACEHARDVPRAEQWIRVGRQVAERRKLPAVDAYCRTHYGGILTAAGRWPEADEVLTGAVRLWTDGGRTLRSTALVRLAELRVRQGRYEEVETLLHGLDDLDATRVRAELRLARGEHASALGYAEHAVQQTDPASSSSIPVFALLVETQVAAAEDPTDALASLKACAEAHPTTYGRSMLALARARAGDPEPLTRLRQAIAGFSEADLPWEAAVARLELARRLQESHPAVAVAEARQALNTFEGLNAGFHLDATNALLRQLGEKVAPPRSAGGALTRREREVFELIGSGMSNPEIAERLFISRKTVEHHVGNILAKLGLRNRAEAAALAVRGEHSTR